MKRRSTALAAVLFAALSSRVFAASFDVSTEYRMRALSYKNLNLDASEPNNRSMLTQSARLGFMFKEIHLSDLRGEEQVMDFAIKLHAVGGVDGSTAPFPAPFDSISNHYPNASLTPFIENAFVRVRNFAGFPMEGTFGRQSFCLGSGLLLDDDGTGLTGAVVRGNLPWGGLRAQAFIFQASNRMDGSANLNLAGGSLELPMEGTWQIHQLVEKDNAPGLSPITECPGGCPTSHATRWFSSIRYSLNYGPLVFDGEAALEKGVATPTGFNSAGGHILYNGNAQVLKAKWKQPLWKETQGIVRMVVARGSGDNPGTPAGDEAFFPSRGHRYDGLERSGFGEFFAATPYDAFGGNSTGTANGLRPGASGIVTVGVGVTPPAWHGMVLDADYFLFQADRNVGSDRTLGSEWDIRLRYDIFDRFSLRASAALFKIGVASNPSQGYASRYMLEASGRF
jgi:hypothetical protein